MNQTTVITTVGTSMFTNYEGNQQYQTSWKRIREASYKDWDTFEDDIEEVQTAIENWAGFSCAELQTLNKLKEKFGEVNTFLLTSDTVAGYLAGSILKTMLPQRDMQVQELTRIEGFDVLIKSQDKTLINKGFENYIIYLLDKSYTGMVFNISGGYKAIIPITTLIASYRGIPLFYNYENSENLVEFPPFPFNFDIDKYKTFSQIFERLDKPDKLFSDSQEFLSLIRTINPADKIFLNSLIITDKENKVSESEIGILFRIIHEDKKPIELVETKKDWSDKTKKFAGDHHGNDVLSAFADKVLKSKYVEFVENSIAYNSSTYKLVNKTYPDGRIELTLHWTDKGYGMIVKTTGRNIKETEAIGKILENEYGK